MKDYKKLDKADNYDSEAATELAEALNEAREVNARLNYLHEIINDNRELHAFIWTTAAGKAIAFRDIEDDHFVNILQHIVTGGRTISKNLKAEARRRGVDLPLGRADNLLGDGRSLDDYMEGESRFADE